jgi:RNA polymerase sigma-70 factor (ECF subfamily)
VLSLGDNGIEEGILKKEDARMVKKLVESLPEKVKVPIILYYSMDMNQADIALTLKLPEGTVKSRLYKGRQMIEKGLIEVGYEK